MVRGGPRGRGRGGHMKHRPPFIPHVPFDIILAEPAFPPMKAPEEGAANPLKDALEAKNKALTPNEPEQNNLSTLVGKIQTVLDDLIVSPGSFDACQIEEVRQVGANKKGTMVTGTNVAEIVVVLKTLPTKEAADALGKNVWETMKKAEPRGAPKLVPNDKGFDLTSKGAIATLYVTTIIPNLRKLDAALHMDAKVLSAAHSLIRQSRWFEENVSNDDIKTLTRLLHDLKRRFEGFNPLSSWMLDLLSHYCILNTPNRKPLSLDKAYKRFFKILSAGFFLPGSAGIVDPVESGHIRVHTGMTLEEQDQVCLTAQTLLRVLSHESGFKQILGMSGNARIATEMSVWDGVVVSPHERAYTKPEKKDDDMEVDKEK